MWIEVVWVKWMIELGVLWVKSGLCCYSDKEAQCELIDQMMQEMIREEFEQEDASVLAACLCQTLHSQFEPSILPQEIDDELVTDVTHLLTSHCFWSIFASS